MTFDKIKEALVQKSLSDEEICKIIDDNPSLALEENYNDKYYRTKSELPVSLAFLAVLNSNYKVLECLIENGAEINKIFYWNVAPLHQAATYLNIEMVKFLLKNGADPTLKSPQGKSALYHASLAYGNGILACHDTEEKQLIQLDIVKLLLELDSSEISEETSELLHAAASSGNVRLIEYYLSLGQNINYKDSEGFTPLARAAYEGNSDAYFFLKDKGATQNMFTNNGRSLAHLAARGNNPEIFKEIVDAGIDTNSPDHIGRLPIHYLLSSGFTEAKNVEQILNLFALDPFPYILGDYVDPLECAVERESLNSREFEGLINIVKSYQERYSKLTESTESSAISNEGESSSIPPHEEIVVTGDTPLPPAEEEL